MLLRTLGGVAMPEAGFSRPKPLLLLTYLTLEGPQERRYLAELFWPGAGRPRQSLSVALSQLRQALPGAVEGDDVRLWATVECDAQQLRDAVAEHDWRAAVELYAGPFLAGMETDTGNVELEEWLYSTRERLAAQAVRALLEVAKETLAAGDSRATARLFERALVAWASTGEDDAQLMQRLHGLAHALGDPVAATLEREAAALGIVLAASPTTGAAPINAGALGLPTSAAAFVGRERELAELERLLAEGARLITITGLGGMGKTSLALALARRLEEHSTFEQVFFVPFEALSDPQRVLERLVAVLMPTSTGDDPLTALRERLGVGRSLLVLDGFEHLTAGAGRIAELLEASPTTSLVVTSREPLGLSAETLYPLAGLALPQSASEALASPEKFGALNLYFLTARRLDPRLAKDEGSLETALGLCRLVVGAPLGIQLAAGLTRAVAPEELLQLLEGDMDELVSTDSAVTERHASLRAVFERSWGLLSEVQRGALAGCSVFRGGFSRAAGAAVLGLDLRRLTALIDRSLLWRTGRRYELHPLVRQYSLEKLATMPAADELRARHAEYFAGLLESKLAFDMAGGQFDAFEELELEYDNLRTAWEWAIAADRFDLLERMTHMFSRFLFDRRTVEESAGLMEAALARSNPESLLTARLLRAKGRLMARSKPAEAVLLLERAVTLAHEFGSPADAGAALHVLGIANAYRGDETSAGKAWSEALPLLERHDTERLLGGCYSNLTLVTADPSESARLLSEAISACRKSENLYYLATVLHNYGVVLSSTYGDDAAALELGREALLIEQRAGRRPYMLGMFHNAVGEYLAGLGDYVALRAHQSEAASLLLTRKPWEDHKFRSYLEHDRLKFVVHDVQGELGLARRVAASMMGDRDVCEQLAWADLAEGDAAALQLHLGKFRDARSSSWGIRSQRLGDVTDNLLSAGVAALMNAGSSTHAANPGVGELLAALRIIIDLTFVPAAFDAFVTAYLVAPAAVDKELLELAASQPAASYGCRRWATELLHHYPSPVPVRLEGVAAPAPSAAKRLEVDAVMNLARDLMWRLTAAQATPSLPA